MSVCDVVLTEDQLSEVSKVLDSDPAYEKASDAWESLGPSLDAARAEVKAMEDAEDYSVAGEQRWIEAYDRLVRLEYRHEVAYLAWWRRILKARANYARKLLEGK
jgi:hypothetical protein